MYQGWYMPKKAMAATETLSPNAAGTNTTWTYTGGSADYTNLLTNDGDTTYATNTANNNVHTVNLQNPTGSGTITSVTTYLVAKGAATEDLGHAVVIGATTYADATLSACAEFNTTTAYATYSCTMATSPATGLAWTWAEVTGMQAGIEGDTVATAQYLTQVYVVVDYTVAVAPSVVSGPTASATQYTTFVDSPFHLNSVFNDNGSAITSCDYSLNNGGSWSAGTVSGSGATTNCDADPTSTDGTSMTILMKATNAGGTTETGTITRTCDTAAPTTTATASGGYTFGTWTATSPVSITLSAGDGTGSGVASGYPKYCVDATDTCSPATSYTVPFDVTCATTCTQYVRYQSVDNVGNTETVKSSQVKQDLQAPTVSSTVPTDGAIDIALDSNVTINWSENVNCATVNTTNITSTSPGWTFSSCSGNQAVFTTSGQANSTTYNVDVTTNVTDSVGNPMAAAYPFSYTTVAAAVDTITIGQGTDPAAAPNLCPGTTGTYLDAFSLQVTSGAATTVTYVQFTTAGTAGTGSIAQVYLTDSGGTPIAGASSTTPAGNVWTLTPSTPLNVGTTATSYRIYVDLKAYASATAGTITGNVSGLGGTAYTVVDNDTVSDTITVDKTAPADATWGTNTAGDGQVTLNWTKSNGADSVLIYMNTVDTDNTAPAGGTTYAVNDTIGTNTVKYVGTGTTTIITGLTNGTTYYFKIFEYDGCENYAGGVWSAGLTPAVGPNTLLHNSDVTGSTKWSPNGWGITGGKYGEFTCGTCHEPRATNIKGVKSTVTAPADTFPGSAVNFQSTTTPNGFGDDATNSPRVGGSTKICEVCHTYDAAQVSGVNAHPYSVVAVLPNHYSGDNADCTTCHKHNVGFKGMGCDSCHGNPPTDASSGGTTGLADDPGPTGSTTAGSHSKHAITLSYACTTCHTNYAMPETPMQIIDIGFNMFDKKDGTGTTYGAATEVNLNDDYRGRNGTTIVDDNTRNCSNLYCHGNFTGGLNDAPTWGGVAGCGTCHGKDATTPPTKINHPRHAGSGAGGLSVACTDCHSVNAGDQSHVNADVHWELNTGSSKFGANAKYKDLATGNTGAVAPSASYGACTNVYCHSNVQNGTGTAVSTSYGTPTWGAASVSCVEGATGCHGNAPATPTANNAHSTHTTGSYIFACSACHNNGGYALTANHANVTLNMTISATYGGTYSQGDHTPGSGGYGNCATVYCHGNYAGSGGASLTPSWAGAVACGDCHKNLNSDPPTPGSHGRHAGQAAGQLNLLCEKCHPSRALGDGHVDLSVQWQLSTGDLKFGASATYRTGASGATGSKAPSTPYGNCNNVYCHSSVQSGNGTGAPLSYDTPTWGAASVTCDSCHGQGAGVNDGSPSTGSHTVHVATYAYTCAVCHTGYGDETTTHANMIINLAFDAATAGGSAAYTGDTVPQSVAFGNCTTTFCHGDSSNTSAEVGNWGTSLSASDACTVCHGTKITDTTDGNAAVINRAPGGSGTGVDTSGTKGTFTRNVSDDPEVGAHDGHLGGVAAISNAIACTECHTVPGSVTTAGHIDSALPAEITFGTLAKTGGAPGGFDPVTHTCSSVYCHNENYFSTAMHTNGGSDTTPTWNDINYFGDNTSPLTATECGRCHFYDGSNCKGCHSHVNADNLSFADKTLHIDGLVQGAGDCVGCHANAQDNLDGAPTRRAMTTEFGLAWGHKKSGRGAVTKYDCGVCHLEGNPSTGAVTTFHKNNLIDLRDPDVNTADTPITGGGFASFARNVSTMPIETTVNNVQLYFCLKCHDAGGAASTYARVTGGTAANPFNVTGVTVLNVDKHFTTTNASAHPIKGARTNSYCNTNTMNAPYGVAKTPGTPSAGVIISCWDCHNTATPKTSGSVTAHGAAGTLRAAYSRPADAPTPLCSLCHKDSVYAADLKGTGDTYSAFGAGGHALDSTPADGKRDDGLDAAADSHIGSRHSGAINDYGCQHCHSSKVSADPGRPIRAEEAHGFNTFTDATTTWPSGGHKPYAFIRNKETFRGIEVRKVGVTTYTPGCTHSNVDDASSVCEAKHDDSVKYIYGPGGAY